MSRPDNVPPEVHAALLLLGFSAGYGGPGRTLYRRGGLRLWSPHPQHVNGDRWTVRDLDTDSRHDTDELVPTNEVLRFVAHKLTGETP